MSVGWILQYGVKAHYNHEGGRLKMISCIFLMYQISLAFLFAFETTVRYLKIVYFMIYVSSFGGLLMMRALQLSVERYQHKRSIVL